MPDFTHEKNFKGVVCGIDEAGRGPLAGAVVAAAVFVPPELYTHPIWKDVRDSKKMSNVKREISFDIVTKILPHGVGIISAKEIDEINILNATLKAMQNAFENLNSKIEIQHALIDGNKAPKLPCPAITIVKGDNISNSIAAASIIAKVTRDRMMAELDQIYPQYGFKNHAGYGTAEHIKALAKYGFCPEHRLSFEPVKTIAKNNSCTAA